MSGAAPTPAPDGPPGVPSELPGRLKAFPIALVTTGRRLVLAGGCSGELCRMRHALAFDWEHIDVFLTEKSRPLCDRCPADPRLHVKQAPVQEEDVRGAAMVLDAAEGAADPDDLARWCRKHGVLLNVMDKPEYCDLYYLALVFRGLLVLAVSSGGASPALSSALRRWMEKHIGPGWAHGADLLADARRTLPAGAGRMDLLTALARDSEFLKRVEKDDRAAMRQAIDDAIDRMPTGT